MPDFLRPYWPAILRIVVTTLVIAAAVYAGWGLWRHFQTDPWTRDGRVRADIVSVTPDVAGLVIEVDVTHDQPVKRGQRLFVIDKARYQLALRQAEAAITTQRATIQVQQAVIQVQRTSIAGRRASLTEATREADRNDGLGNLVAREQIEQSHTRVAEQQSALAQNEAAVAQAEAAVDQAKAALIQAEATRDTAALNLARTEVTAPADGFMSDVGLRVGDYVSPGRPALALIDQASLRVEGYFEETKLPGLKIGQPVEIRLMGEDKALRGHITSIADAIEDRERAASPNLLPNVNPTFSWVRLAQRVPVRIALDNPPADIRLIAGRTASVIALDARDASK